MINKKLAVLGGSPVRNKPFIVGPMIDAEEENLVLTAIREQNFSRYIGAHSSDIETILRVSSAEAAVIQAPWHFLGGPNVRLFGAQFSQKFGSKYSIPVNSATSGLSIALAACGVGPGDEVIVPGLSYSATGSAVLLFNSIPVFVDVDPLSFCIDPDAIELAVTPRTRAILVVHLLGNLCDMDRIMEIAAKHKLVVIEDVAQAPGAKWRGRYAGTIGKAGVFSFQQSKNIMTGEGGMVITDDPEVARKCRLISNHGEIAMQDSNSDDDLENVIGCNFRMPELCAALGRAQLEKLDQVNAWRNRNASFLVERLSQIPGLLPPKIDERVDWICHVLAFLFDEQQMGIPRSLFVAALRAEGIPVGTGYVRAMYENPTFLRKIAYGQNGSPWSDTNPPSKIRYYRGQCPEVEKLINEKFLWFYHVAHPSTIDDMEDIARAVEKVAANIEDLKINRDLIQATGDTAKQQGRL
jgi:perosamine synthetase